MTSAIVDHEDPQAIIARLTAENERLRAAMIEGGVTAPRDWGLTSFEDKIFRMLVKNEVVSKAALLAFLYAEEDRRDPKMMDVFIHRIRKKTKDFGVIVNTILGVGYSLADRKNWQATLKVTSETKH